MVLCFAGYEYVPVCGGYAISCLASVEGAKVEGSMNESVIVTKLDPFSVWHEVSVECNLWRDCRWCQQVIA